MNNYLQESYEDAIRENALLKSKLELAEKALETIFEDVRHVERQDIRDIAETALEAIRGN